MAPLLIPLEGHGHHGSFDGGGSWLPLVDGVLLLLVLLAGAVVFYLWRKGTLTLPLAVRRSPEDHAKQVLADRFARGDISTEEFMERSSILNWTPGSDTIRKRRSRAASRRR